MCEVDAVVKNTVKSQEWRNGASNKNLWGQKKKYLHVQRENEDNF